MSAFASKLILVSVFVYSVCPLCADIVSVPVPGGAIYDCGQAGSANLQSCLNAMSLGEAQFLASYTPSGSPLPSNWASMLPPPAMCPSPGACSYTLGPSTISNDMLSQIIFETDFPTYNEPGFPIFGTTAPSLLLPRACIVLTLARMVAKLQSTTRVEWLRPIKPWGSLGRLGPATLVGTPFSHLVGW
jgi:hypothetical protein